MNSPISGRACRLLLSAPLVWAVSGEAIAATIPPTFERVQALPLSPKESRVKLLEVGGAFYGTSQLGGTSDQGTLFKLATDGTLTILVNFNGTNGATPKGGLILGTDGTLYGTTESGGASGKGTVFRVTTGGTLTTLSSFTGTNGSGPIGGVALGSDGNYYGTTKAGGTSDKGTVFKMTSAGAITSLASFDGTNGSAPAGRLVADAGGLFYGVCSSGGASNKGSVYTVTTGGTVTRLASFDGTNGEQPVSSLTPEGNGNFLGSTWGSFVTSGSLFRITPTGTLTRLVDMGATRPSGDLTLLEDGNYYGTAYSGGTSSIGSVFKLTPAGDFSTVSSFTIANGANPAGGLTLGSDGQIYGVTSSGGRIPGGSNALNGVFFRMSTGGAITVLNTFYDSIGRTPLAGLTLATDGNFYGTASDGGGSAYGTIFRMTPQGALSVVHNCKDLGLYPKAVVSVGGVTTPSYLYTTTSYGGPLAPGSQSNGTVLKINPATDEVTIEQQLNVNFSVAVGAQTAGPVVNNGVTTYGMTSVGGSGGLGTFYRSFNGAITTLAEFSSSTGNTPLGGPILTTGNYFYASTSAGGTGGKGTIFKIQGTSGQLNTLVNFDGTNGGTPVGELVLQGSNLTGTFYGVTRTGGTADKGTVFKMTPTGTLTTLASFTGANGSTPRSGLVFGRDGNLYGTTEKGGTYDMGTVYQITPAGVLTTIVSFDGSNGSYPWSRLVSASGGYLYGTTSTGGTSPLNSTSGGGGQIFRVRVNADVVTGIADPISFNAALLHGTANPVDANTTVSFEYGTDSTLATSTTLAANITTGNDFNGVASPLAPFTTYYYRAVNTLEDGVTRIRGNIQSFTTLPAPPDIAVDAGGQTNLTSDGAAVIVPNTTVGQSRDFAITIRTSSPTSTLSSLSASIPEQSGGFSILQQPAASVAYGSTTTLVVRFTPVVTGGGTATVAIASDDADESPFIVHLRAWGGTTFAPVIDPANPDPVEWDGFTATGITLSGTTLTGPPHRGTEYVILSNPGDAAVTGTFNGLPEGSLVTLTYGGNNYRFLLSYEGGDGNDIVLSYWPETDINPEDSPEAFLFAALDSDRDDQLTLTEWQGIYAKIPKKEAIFSMIDTDKNGVLSFAEFTAGATNRTASRTITTAVNRTAIFMEVDTSFDNIVSRAEIAFMWKPGTAAKTIDAYWTRAKGGDGMDFWEWLWASTLPSFTTYDQAGTMRAQRLAIATQLDTDTSGTITFAEFSHLYKPGTKTTTIDTAWRAANATPRGTASPADMTINAFVEAAKLPKLTVF